MATWTKRSSWIAAGALLLLLILGVLVVLFVIPPKPPLDACRTPFIGDSGKYEARFKGLKTSGDEIEVASAELVSDPDIATVLKSGQVQAAVGEYFYCVALNRGEFTAGTALGDWARQKFHFLATGPSAELQNNWHKENPPPGSGAISVAAPAEPPAASSPKPEVLAETPATSKKRVVVMDSRTRATVVDLIGEKVAAVSGVKVLKRLSGQGVSTTRAAEIGEEAPDLLIVHWHMLRDPKVAKANQDSAAEIELLRFVGDVRRKANKDVKVIVYSRAFPKMADPKGEVIKAAAKAPASEIPVLSQTADTLEPVGWSKANLEDKSVPDEVVAGQERALQKAVRALLGLPPT